MIDRSTRQHVARGVAGAVTPTALDGCWAG